MKIEDFKFDMTQKGVANVTGIEFTEELIGKSKENLEVLVQELIEDKITLEEFKSKLSNREFIMVCDTALKTSIMVDDNYITQLSIKITGKPDCEFNLSQAVEFLVKNPDELNEFFIYLNKSIHN